MQLFQIKQFIKNIKYLLTEDEVETLYNYASKVPDGGRIVDVGTCAGGSAFVMTLASKNNVKILTLDPVKNDSFMENKELLPNPDKLHFANIPSSSFRGKEPIDLLFIDGIHNYEGVMGDFGRFNLKRDGIVIFHDYYLYRDTIGKAVDELEQDGKIEKIEIIDSLYNGETRTGMYIARCK